MRLVVKPERASLFFALLLVLSACGFEPLYSAKNYETSVAAQLAQVRVGEIRVLTRGELLFRDYPVENSRSGQLLRNRLSDDLFMGRYQAPSRYLLNVDMYEPQADLAIDRSDTIIRYGYSTVANFYLRDDAGKQLFASTSHSTTSYSASQSEFATLSSRRDARDRTIEEISLNIRDQLATFFYKK
jgi:hypothetical protein